MVNPRRRFWIELGLAVLSGLLLVLELVRVDWIESLLGVDPIAATACSNGSSRSSCSSGRRRSLWSRASSGSKRFMPHAALSPAGAARIGLA
jgi:hypothetical protein